MSSRKAKKVEERRTKRLHQSTFTFPWDDVPIHLGTPTKRKPRKTDNDEDYQLDAEHLIDMIS